MATVWLNPSPRNILPFLWQWLVAGFLWLGLILLVLQSQPHPTPFFIRFTWRLLILFFVMVVTVWMFRDLFSILPAITPPCDKLMRLMFMVSLNLISLTNYRKGAQAAISLITLIALAGCYDQQSNLCYFEWLGNKAFSSMQLPHCLLLARMHSGKNASLLATHNGLDLWVW